MAATTAAAATIIIDTAFIFSGDDACAIRALVAHSEYVSSRVCMYSV